MRLSISNLAWNRDEDSQVAPILQRFAIDAIDIAPGKYFDLGCEPNYAQVEAVRAWWSGWGIEVYGMQALMYGTNNLNLFGTAESKGQMLSHLERVCRIGQLLGASRLTFGSPSNRDRARLGDEETRKLAVEFFRRLGDLALANKVLICLEPNPPRYHCNFMTTTLEARDIVEATAHPGIRLQVDTGAMLVNGECPSEVIPRVAPWVGHIHLSEPDLLPLGSTKANHRSIALELSKNFPDKIATIEMVRLKNVTGLDWIETSLQFASVTYGD